MSWIAGHRSQGVRSAVLIEQAFVEVDLLSESGQVVMQVRDVPIDPDSVLPQQGETVGDSAAAAAT